ncbi:WYL domain-containing protein [Micrococcales bacterium 31B]|nr:WYL domain-containing protein [Micrococcales bacterium 31B]
MAKRESTEMIARLVALAQYIGRHGPVTRTELMRVFSLTRAQLAKALTDLTLLGELADRSFYSLEVLDESEEVSLGNLGVLEKPLRFTPEEAMALLVSLDALRERMPEHEALIVETLDKLRGAAGLSDRFVPRPLATLASEVAELETALRGAIAAKQRVEIEYRKQGARSGERRVIAPHELVVDTGASYVRAWCFASQAVRVFKLSRIESWAPLGEPARLSADAKDALAAASGAPVRFEPDASAVPVHLRLRPPAGWLLEHFDGATWELLDENTADLRFAASNLERVADLVVKCGGAAEAIEPYALRERVLQVALERRSHFRERSAAASE